MRTVMTTIRAIFLIAILGLLHYVLPQHDVVRITGTEVIRVDFSKFNRLFYAQADSSNTEMPTRDLRLINTQKRKTFLLGFYRRESEEVMVFRNEDTGWIWPPYFKFDSSDLQAEATANISPPGAEKWVVITHYGWRNRFFSIYPNAIGIREVEGPNVTIIPWINIGFFIFLIVAWLTVRGMWRQFRERSLDPVMDDIDQVTDRASSRARGTLTNWFGSSKK